MNQLQIFNFNNNEVRTVLIDNEPYFVGKDVAEVLGYSNPRKALKDHIDEEDKGVTKCDTLGGKQDLTIINESGLYSLVLSSKLPQAKSFKRWVTKEVLPAIRKTGSYQTPTNPMDALELMFQAQKQSNEQIAVIDHRVIELEENAPLNPGEYNFVSKKVSERIRQIKRERCLDLNRQQVSELYKAINREIKVITGVQTRSQLRQKHLNGVIEFIRDWEPSKATMVIVSQLAMEV